MQLKLIPKASILSENHGVDTTSGQSADLVSHWPLLGEIRQSLLERSSIPPVVLLISENDGSRKSTASLLREEGCNLIEVCSGTAAIELLETSQPDLVILDRDMEQMDGLECCRIIKGHRRRELIPVLMTTTIISVQNEIDGMQSGADEYITIPFHPEVFRARIRSLIRHKTAIDRLEESEAILFALAQAVEKRDHCVAGHCQRLALYSVAFGIRLGLPQTQLLALHRGGYLHDMGKIAIPDAILFKPGKLSPEEWILMKTHSVRGEEICQPLRSLHEVLPIIRNHHERWDGTGYPDGLSGTKIPLLARVLQLADAYDALTSDRPYKAAYTREAAIETLLDEARLGWRETELTEIFTNLPLRELDIAAQKSFTGRESDDFESSIRNLRRHLHAIAS